MTDAARVRVDPVAPAESSLLYPVRGVPIAVQEELRSQLETAEAFADFCAFLTAGAESDRAAQLVTTAQALYDETMTALRRHGTPE